MVKLLPSGPQREALKSTLRRTNEARDYASGVAWDMGTYANKYRLQQLAYHDIKERFSPTAQVVIHLLAKVADAYKLDRRTKRTFRPYGAIAYDDRILRRYSGAKEVSIWTTEGPQRIGFVCEECTRARLASRRGESDLVYRSGKWYLLATVEVEEPPPAGTPGVWLGVDLGVANIASDSDGEIHTSERVEKSRKRYERIRAKLQAAGTKSAKRHLKKLSGKRLRRSQRGRHGKWAFGQLRSSNTRAGLPVSRSCVSIRPTPRRSATSAGIAIRPTDDRRASSSVRAVDTLPTPIGTPRLTSAAGHRAWCLSSRIPVVLLMHPRVRPGTSPPL